MLNKLNPAMASFIPFMEYLEYRMETFSGGDSEESKDARENLERLSNAILSLGNALNTFDSTGDINSFKLALINNEFSRYIPAEQFTRMVLADSAETIKRELSALSPRTLLESDPDYARFALNKMAETGADANRDNSETAGFMASQAVVNKDPIILDMNRDGRIGTSGAKFFDLDANGAKEVISWASSGDAILVVDKNSDGEIEGGAELFGDRYQKADGSVATGGLDALSDVDSNGDNIVDSKDEEYGKLKVWTDSNGNGVYEDDELVSLEKAGITSINLGSESVGTIDSNGNKVISQGSFTWADGTEGLLGEFGLRGNNDFTIDADTVKVPEDIAALPDLHGRGSLLSLHQSMARDESERLKALVEAFGAEGDQTARLEVLDRILYAWSGASEVAPDSRGGNFDAQKLFFLERYWGSEFIGAEGTGDPNTEAAVFLTDSYEYAKEQIYAQLLAETFYKNMITDSIMIDDETGEIRLDLSGAISQIYSVWAEDADLGGIQLKEFLMALDAKGLRDNLSAEELRLISDAISNTSPEFAEVFVETNTVNLSGESKNYDLNFIGFAGDDNLTGGNGNDRLSGDEGNDHISGNGGDDTLNGGSGDDRLFGGDGSDVMRGGQGDDILDGGKCDDKYIWNAGDGNDLISDGEGENTLEIGEGIDPTKVKISRKGDNLVIQTDDEDKGSVTAVDWYKGSSFGVNEISFADGTKWSREDIDAIASGLREPFSVADDELTLFGASNQATDWTSDPTLAAIMEEQPISTASDFAAEQMRMDIAVALLGFGGLNKEQVVDFMGIVTADSGQVGLTSGNSGGYFEKEPKST